MQRATFAKRRRRIEGRFLISVCITACLGWLGAAAESRAQTSGLPQTAGVTLTSQILPSSREEIARSTHRRASRTCRRRRM